MELSIGSHSYSFQRVILTAISIIVLVVIGYWLEHHVAAIENWLSGLGHWAGLGFIALFLVLTPFFFSVDILCVIAGALFSLPNAIGYVLVATMFSAAVIFYIGRNLARSRIQEIVQKHPKLTVFDQLIAQGGFKIMFLLRLLPFPFAILSYVFSISRVQFWPYWFATTGIFFYNSVIVYFGYIAMHMTKQLSQGEDYSGPHNTMMVGGVIGCIIVLYLVSKIARAQLAQLQPDIQQHLP